MRFSLRRLTFATALVALTALGAAACGDDDDSSGSATPTVSGAWSRASASMASAGAAYMELKGGEADDALVAASAPADVAGKTEIHETTKVASSGATGSGSMGSGSTGSGMMEMRPVAKIDVPKGTTVSLAPGGYHVMLLELKQPLTVGQKFTLTLTFEKAGKVDVPVEVRAS